MVDFMDNNLVMYNFVVIPQRNNLRHIRYNKVLGSNFHKHRNTLTSNIELALLVIHTHALKSVVDFQL